MGYRFVSPYLDLDAPHRWLRGNHHGHSLLSDGEQSPEENIAAYEAAGYDYLALSEHDVFADPATLNVATGMMLIPAVEITSRDDQTLMYLGATTDLPVAGTLSLPEVMDFVQSRGGLFVVDHPNWLYRADRLHAPAEELLPLSDLGAIEIFTGVIERLPGASTATDVWDRLLTAGRRVFGHATDDQHDIMDRFLGWNAVQWPADEPPAWRGIVEALRQGRFYASTGVSISRIGLSADGQRIELDSDAERVRWITRGGIVVETSMSGTAHLDLGDLLNLPTVSFVAKHQGWGAPTDLIYIRAECIGPAGSRAWTQPFFIESAA